MANYYKTRLKQFLDESNKGSAGLIDRVIDRYRLTTKETSTDDIPYLSTDDISYASEELPAPKGTSTDDISSLSEEKRNVEERIAFLKEEIARQKNIKDAEGSPLMEIALYRFNTYGDPSGLSEIANRQQTKDMADLQKREADEANIKATKDKLGRLNIIAKNARDILNDAKNKDKNSAEHKSAIRDYNLARYDLISAAKATNDDELVNQYMDAYPEEIDTASSNSPEVKSLVVTENDYERISLDETMTASERAKKLQELGRPKDISDEKWIALKKGLDATLKAAYEKEDKAYKASGWHKRNKELFEKRDALKKANADPDKIREINRELREDRKVSKEVIKRDTYPKFEDVKKPEKPAYLN